MTTYDRNRNAITTGSRVMVSGTGHTGKILSSEIFFVFDQAHIFFDACMSHKAGEKTLTPNGMRGNELLFAKPVAIFLADLAHRFADFLQMLRHCTFYRIAITFLQGRENIKMLA